MIHLALELITMEDPKQDDVVQSHDEDVRELSIDEIDEVVAGASYVTESAMH